MKWIIKYLNYIPTTCPEELVLKAELGDNLEKGNNSQYYKDKLYNMACAHIGKKVPNEQADDYGEFLLAGKRQNSKELEELKIILENFSHEVRQ
ncbi:hypothetical protein CSR02_04635 [Acetobacter pomorum]|uniref:Uncharacterized protein n=1 Tax=Acetobacter pomorum TaxID=65959 RepID=A0A2G4RGC7_9PROT|nr:hypothetical protein [Acetobacter pomorum]PHY94745.1 hypothetical protein CSR02_04635 [Acetobacter pomorum]